MQTLRQIKYKSANLYDKLMFSRTLPHVLERPLFAAMTPVLIQPCHLLSKALVFWGLGEAYSNRDNDCLSVSGLFMSPFPFCSFSFHCLQRFHPSAFSLHLSLTLFKLCFPHGTSVTGHPASLFVGSSPSSCPSAVVSRSEHSLILADS